MFFGCNLNPQAKLKVFGRLSILLIGQWMPPWDGKKCVAVSKKIATQFASISVGNVCFVFFWSCDIYMYHIYVCVYVYIYICMCIYIYMYMYMYMISYIYIYMCVCLCVYVCVHMQWWNFVTPAFSGHQWQNCGRRRCHGFTSRCRGSLDVAMVWWHKMPGKMEGKMVTQILESYGDLANYKRLGRFTFFFQDLVSTRGESWGYSWICPRIGDVCPVYITIWMTMSFPMKYPLVIEQNYGKLSFWIDNPL